MLNEQRRQEIAQQLKRERETRRQFIQNGQLQTYIDETIIPHPQLGTPAKEQPFEEREILTKSSLEYSDNSLQQQATNGDQENLKPIGNNSSSNFVYLKLAKKLKEMKDRLFSKGCTRKQCNKSPSPEKKVRSPSPQLFERLAKPKNEVQVARELMKQEFEEKEIIEKCPFQPQISENSQFLANLKYTNFQGDIVQRLSLLEKERQQHIDQLRADKILNELKLPQRSIQQNLISEDNQEPLHKRLAKVVKEKQNYIMNLQSEQLKKEVDFFHPNINPQSNILAQIKNDGENVIERLTKHGIKRQQRLMDASSVSERSFSEKYRFKPSINKDRNEQILTDQPEDFYERQQEFQKKLALKQSQLRQSFEQKENCTFHPQVNQKSEQLFQKNNNANNTIERLYEKDQSKKEQFRQENEIVFPFKPLLNQTSLELAMNRSLEDLINNDYAKQRNEQLKSKIEEEEKQACSFYPAINDNSQYSNMQSQYSFKNCADTIKAQIVEKERLRKQLLKEKEDAELEMCTFQPHINNEPLRKGNVEMKDVKGVEQFLSNVDNHQRKLKEKQNVEEKLFEIHKQYDYEKHSAFTKPEPFQISQRKGRQGYSKKK